LLVTHKLRPILIRDFFLYRVKSMAGVSISREFVENACYIASKRRKEANERERELWVIYWLRTRAFMYVGECGRAAAEIKD